LAEVDVVTFLVVANTQNIKGGLPDEAAEARKRLSPEYGENGYRSGGMG
jgi:hypothetical protein